MLLICDNLCLFATNTLQSFPGFCYGRTGDRLDDNCSSIAKGEQAVEWIFQTYDTYAFLFLRFGLAVTFFMHGTQHAFGWHGGKGPKAQVTNWRDKYGIPVPMGVLALVIELSTVVCMVLGFFVRPVAFGLAVFMAFATFLSHWEHGFFLSLGSGKRQRHRVHDGVDAHGPDYRGRRRRRIVGGYAVEPLDKVFSMCRELVESLPMT